MLRFLFSVCLISKLQPINKSLFSRGIDVVIHVVVAFAVTWLMTPHRKVIAPNDTSVVPHWAAICNNFAKNDQFKV